MDPATETFLRVLLLTQKNQLENKQSRVWISSTRLVLGNCWGAQMQGISLEPSLPQLSWQRMRTFQNTQRPVSTHPSGCDPQDQSWRQLISIQIRSESLSHLGCLLWVIQARNDHHRHTSPMRISSIPVRIHQPSTGRFLVAGMNSLHLII